MHKYIMDLLQCPMCGGELLWDISEENEIRVVNGISECAKCSSKYPVMDTIGWFIDPKLQKFSLWNRNQSRLNNLIKKKLLQADIHLLSPMELMYKGDILFEGNKIEEANKLYEMAFSNVDSSTSRSAIDDQINYLADKVSSREKFIVDIASGRCAFVSALLKKKNIQAIATDINPVVLSNNRKKFIALGVDKRVSQLAFDVKKTPFKNHSISTMTSYTGLQNVFHFGATLNEIKRINHKYFYSANFFIPNKQDENYLEVERSGNKQMWIKELFMEEFNKLDWQTTMENSRFAPAKAITRGSIIQWQETSFLPVVDTTYEYNVSISER